MGAIFDSGSTLIAVFGQALILLIGGKMVLNGSLTIGALTAFILYLTSFFAPIQQLVQLYNTYQQGQAAVTKLRDLLNLTPSVPESPQARDLPEIKGEIELDRVSFSYNSGKAVLEDISLTVHPGETIAFVGETGAGKSTLAKLIIRFYDPQSGTVRIDGLFERSHLQIPENTTGLCIPGTFSVCRNTPGQCGLYQTGGVG